MELYKLIATINNTAETFTFDFLPENFEGVKINQKFSFVNPMGYTPKFSVETMRIIQDDKTAIDAVFDTYGLQSDVTIQIQKLNATATGYDVLSTFAIDFESYEKFDYYSAFALKSVSSYDLFVSKKNTEKSYLLGAKEVSLPNTLKSINYVSLKRKDVDYFGFDPNNQSKIYDSDYSLYDPDSSSNPDQILYVFGSDIGTSAITVRVSATINILIKNYTGNAKIRLVKYNASTGVKTILYTFLDGSVVSSGTPLNLILSKIDINCGVCSDKEVITIIDDVYLSTIKISGDIFIDIKKKTDLKILSSDSNIINYRSTAEILNDIFDYGYSTTDLTYLDRGITSANHLAKNSNSLTIKPGEFISDLAKILGLVVNHKIDGNTQIDKMSDYFDTILNTANAIEITNFKDLSIKYNSDLNFNSVQFGKEISDYEIYGYWINWNKLLTFIQSGRKGFDDLDLSLTKYRTDFSGILDYFVKRSSLSDKDSKDIFIFDYSFTSFMADNEPEIIYDPFTPRNMLLSWKRFLSFCFQNFSLNTLTLSSNGGSEDNLQIDGVNQMDDVVLDETPRLLPIEYNLTCLIDDVDFSENILKINDNGTDIYLFVIDAETTDKLSEQKIKGLKIQF